MKRLAALIALLATPAWAGGDYCSDYWFVRNQVFDRAGYCFQSTLGQAIFDNSDCVPGEVELRPADQALVNEIREIEARLGCRVDTGRASLPILLIGLRLRLEDLAARDEHSGSACFGYKGAPFTLHAGHRADAQVLGTVQPGDDLFFRYSTPQAPAGWDYVEVEHGGSPKGLGWFSIPFSADLCTQVAG